VVGGPTPSSERHNYFQGKMRRIKMKTKYMLLTLALVFGTVVSAFAGNHPAVPNGSGVPLSSIHTGYEIGPKGHKTTVVIANSVVESGVWYRSCPSMANMTFNKTNRMEIVLSNGKKITLACKDCLGEIESHLDKYVAYMYL
jgi:hypothetical protein